MISFAGRHVRRPHLAIAALATIVSLSVFFMGSVTAYVGTNPFVVSFSVSGPSNGDCSQNAVVSVKVRDTNSGKAVDHQSVAWSFKSRQAKDGLSPSSSTTSKSGVAATTVVFGPDAGTRKVSATIGGYANTVAVSCSKAAAKTPKPSKSPKPTPTPDKTKKPKPTPTATQKTAENATPTPNKTKKPKPTPTSTPFVETDSTPTDVPVVGTDGAVGGITPAPSETTLTGVVGSTGPADPAASVNAGQLPATSSSDSGGGGLGFDFGMLALLVIGALAVLVVVFLVRQPQRVRR